MPPRKSNASVTSSTPAGIALGDTSFDSNATIPAGQDGTPSEKKTAAKDGLSVEVRDAFVAGALLSRRSRSDPT